MLEHAARTTLNERGNSSFPSQKIRQSVLFSGKIRHATVISKIAIQHIAPCPALLWIRKQIWNAVWSAVYSTALDLETDLECGV